jgi:hypothetical protein
MANQTVTTVVNYDDAAISGLLDGEVITINGGSVTVNADVRWNQQAAVFGAVTLSGTLGGSFLIDGTQVWEVPFSASSGNVPTQNALGSNGVTGGTSGATGELTRVWATGSLDPATAGAAMPGTGFIKLRSKTGTFQSGETITLPGGATVTASGAGKRSWIHVVGREATSLTIPRLATFELDGDWYEIGTTDGTDDQTFQFPVADMCPSIWVETSAGSGVYEIWNYAADRWGVEASGVPLVPTDARGKFFGMTFATGVIEIAKRTGTTSGYKPASGCKVRVPNVILSSAPATNYDSNTLNATIATRYDTVTTSAGSLVMSYASCNWYIVTSNAFNVALTNCSFADSVSLSNTGNNTAVTNCGVSPSGVIAAGGTLSLTNSFNGGTVTDCRVTRLNGTNAVAAFTVADCDGFTFTRMQGDLFGANNTTPERTSGTVYAMNLARLSNSNIVDCSGVGGILNITSCSKLNISDFKYADKLAIETNLTAPATAYAITTAATDIFIDGFEAYAGLNNVLPSTAIITVASGSLRVEARNIGTAAVPLDGGSAVSNRPNYLLSASVCIDVTLRRCYVNNFRGTTVGAINAANTAQNVNLINVWSNNTVTQRLQSINTLVEGCSWVDQLTTGESAVYGSHWRDTFQSSTTGSFIITGHEPTTGTADQCSFTLDAANGSGFTSAGSITMTQTTDTVTWTMPYYAIGWTGIGKQTAAANTFLLEGGNPQNFELDYQINKNDGAGFSAWTHLVSFVRRNSLGTAGTNTIALTLTDWDTLTRTPQVGDYIQGNLVNFPAGTTITNISVGASFVTITLSNNITTSNPTYCAIWKDIANEVIDPIDGIKLKVRARVLTASTSNGLRYIKIPADTTATDYVRQYPLPTDRQGVITNMIAGSRLQIYNVTTSTEIVNRVVTGTSYTYDYNNGTGISDGDTLRIRLAWFGGATASIGYEGFALANDDGFALLAAQTNDDIYQANAIDGSTVTEFVFDYPNVQVDINDPDGSTSITRLYAWWCKERTTADGIRTLIGGLVAEDAGNYKVVTDRINLKLDNTASTGVIFTGDLRLYRDDGVAPVVTSTTGGGSITLYAGKVYTVAVGSGVTNQDKTDIINGVWNAAVSSYASAGSTGKTLDETKKAANLAANLAAAI